jgi:hypothetical protein
VDQLTMGSVRGPKDSERLRQLGQAVHALLAEMRLEGVGAGAAELFPAGHPSRSVSGTRNAFAILSKTASEGVLVRASICAT